MKKLFALLACLLMLCPCVLAEDAAAPVLEIHQMALGYADGYYLRCGDVEINCSFETVFAQVRASREAEVCRILFG